MPATTEPLVTRLRQGRVARRGEHQVGRTATWNLLKVALLVPVLTTVVLALVLTVTKLLAGGAFGGLSSQSAAAWLAVNQVPLTVGGVTVGVLPMLPTMVLIAAVAMGTARACREVDSLQEVATIAGAALAGPLVWTALALAVVADGAAVSALGQPAPLPAFAFTLLVQGIGVAIGTTRRCVQPLLAMYEFPVADRVGGRAGLLAFAGLLGGGLALVVIAGLVKWDRIGELIATGNSFDGYLGLILLSILYLPNVVVGALGVAVGASVQVGTATIDAISVHPGAVPPLPILGLLPESSMGPLGAFVFVVPVAVGVAVGWYCRSYDIAKHLRAVGVAAATCAALVVLACGMSGGAVGELGRVGVSAPLAGVYTFAWIAILGAVTAGVHRVAPASWFGDAEAGSDDDFDLDRLLAEDAEFADLEIVEDPDLDTAADTDTDTDDEDEDDETDAAEADVDEDFDEDADVVEAAEVEDEDVEPDMPGAVTEELPVTSDEVEASTDAPERQSTDPGH
ncbi:DUF6350 family protein [Gordonia alkaliphila]|uniref:cell division protein PerM n=1 Tax=Gordonia alkaliphila TaxID=1053547 RepID=UPI001FF2E3CC|nr:DUF6350 family protein [Gordonia alkaliphila]MCK0439686.1 DUF6350 family protein [Gordonia alkaliphila]